MIDSDLDDTVAAPTNSKTPSADAPDPGPAGPTASPGTDVPHLGPDIVAEIVGSDLALATRVASVSRDWRRGANAAWAHTYCSGLGCDRKARCIVRMSTPRAYRCGHCRASMHRPSETHTRCSPDTCPAQYELDFPKCFDGWTGTLFIEKDECDECGRRNMADLDCRLGWAPGEREAWLDERAERLRPKPKARKTRQLPPGVVTRLAALAAGSPDAEGLRFRLKPVLRFAVHKFCEESGVLASQSEGVGPERVVVVTKPC